MNVDIQNRYHTGFNSKKSVTAVNQTTQSSMRSEATLWSSFEGTYLLVSQRLWALDRTFFHYLGLQRLRTRQKERGEKTMDDYSSFWNASGLQSILSWINGANSNSSQKLKQKYFSDWHRVLQKELLSYPCVLSSLWWRITQECW